MYKCTLVHWYSSSVLVALWPPYLTTQASRLFSRGSLNIIIIVATSIRGAKDGDDGGAGVSQKPDNSNFQAAPKNCGFTTLKKLKNVWAETLALELT